MKRAQELFTITKDVEAKREEEMLAKAREFAEKTYPKLLEEAVQTGHYSAIVPKAQDMLNPYVKQYLQRMGYKVEESSPTHLNVSWRV